MNGADGDIHQRGEVNLPSRVYDSFVGPIVHRNPEDLVRRMRHDGRDVSNVQMHPVRERKYAPFGEKVFKGAMDILHIDSAQVGEGEVIRVEEV